MRAKHLTIAGLLAFPFVAISMTAGASDDAFVGPFHTTTTIASTVPANGDVNPYGVATVQVSTGRLTAGDTIVSNFNDFNNLQGRGSTIMEISPTGDVTTFAAIDPASLNPPCPGGVGLTTALVVLRSGWVIVGSLPTTDGMSATMQAGCLIVLNRWGHAVETISGGLINGPWDMTAAQGDEEDEDGTATLFVTNVLNGTVAASPNVVTEGTVVRIRLRIGEDGPPQVASMTLIGAGFAERTDPMALVVGPTGVGLGEDDTLYVADTANSDIVAIRHASTRTTPTGGHTISSGGAVNASLGLTIAPNGDILTVNGGDGNLVELTPEGEQVAVRLLDATPPIPTGGSGTLFGLAIARDQHAVVYVDDGNNTLNLLH